MDDATRTALERVAAFLESELAGQLPSAFGERYAGALADNRQPTPLELVDGDLERTTVPDHAAARTRLSDTHADLAFNGRCRTFRTPSVLPLEPTQRAGHARASARYGDRGAFAASSDAARVVQRVDDR